MLKYIFFRVIGFLSINNYLGGESMKKLVLTGVLLFAALLFAGTQQGYAYDNVTSTPDGGCLACHPGFAGGSGAGHTTHSGVTGSCGACHPGSVPGKNVKSSTCIVCHPTGDVGACNLVVAHGASSSCITCHSACAPPPAGQAECADWVGDWKFTYDNATTTNICFDNSSIDNETFTLCDNDTAANCQCLDDVTAQQLCLEDIAPYVQCDPDNYSGSGNCVCVANPFYKAPGPNGVQDVSITQALADNVTFQGRTAPCLASGTRGTTPVTIVQVDNATAAELGIANLTYIVFEGADFDNVTFAEILPANFTKDNDSTQFTAETLFNSIGLVSGIKSDNETPPPECEQNLRVIPGTIFRLLSFVNPFSAFVITIDWGTEAINDLIHIKLGKRLIFGFGFARPFQLVAGDYIVKVTYGDSAAEACGELTVR
jgi:hypothetical protein